jgi:hypothetical protein
MNVDSDNFTTDKHSGLADGPERNTVVSRESEAMDTIIPTVHETSFHNLSILKILLSSGMLHYLVW